MLPDIIWTDNNVLRSYFEVPFSNTARSRETNESRYFLCADRTTNVESAL